MDPDSTPLSPAVRNAILTGVVLGVVAGLAVWFLERFELNRLHGEVRDYLEHHDAFLLWQKDHGDRKEPGS